MLDDSPTLSPFTNGHSDEVDKRKSFRLQAIQEILTSERSYLNQLELLINYFVNPLKEQNIITQMDFMSLFGQVHMIYSLNHELLVSLETDLESVAKAFKRMAPFFKLYSVYAFDYNRAQLILQVRFTILFGFLFYINNFLGINREKFAVQKILRNN